MRVAANESNRRLNDRIRDAFAWASTERIEWLSPVKSDEYAEYYDEEFLERLGVSNVRVPLHSFWPRSGPRWDGLARTDSGKVILVEAKAGMKIEELCRKYGISSATYYSWKAKFGGMSIPDAKRLRALEAENSKLKRLVGELSLDIIALKDVVSRKW